MWTSKLMVDGVWRGDVIETPEIAARHRADAGSFRGRVTACGRSGFRAEPGRYHLYVSYGCPFAHRTILVHTLKRLHDVIGLSVVHPRWNNPAGWTFTNTEGSTSDRAGNGFRHLHTAFAASKPDYTGRVTVPVLWDTVRKCIVNDDSREIAVDLNDAFDQVGGDPSVNLVPPALRQQIEALCDTIVADVAVGAYRIGGAPDQAAFDMAESAFFAALGRLDQSLSNGYRFLHGDSMTLSDVILFTPVVRFEPVYRPLFRALRYRLCDFPHLASWHKRMLDDPRVAATVWAPHILAHYYDGWAPRNPRLVPRWPE